jgi:uncharacterized protein (DUF927 family)
LVAAAGELATALGTTGWREGDATWAARVCFQAWLDRRGHIGPAELQDGIDQVRRFFALHGESRFTPEQRSATAHPVINRAGFIKGSDYCVFPEVFRSEIATGFEWHSLAAALVKRGMLISETAESIRGPDGKTVRMFCFTSAALADEDDTVETDPREGDA